MHKFAFCFERMMKTGGERWTEHRKRERDAESVEERCMHVGMVGKGRKIDAVIVCCKSNKNVITAMRVVAQLCVHFAFICNTHTLTLAHTERNYLFHTIFNALFYNNNETE